MNNKNLSNLLNKKNTMKEFNLTEYLKNPSQKVVTRDGREVRIICTDAKGDEPIVALVYNNIRDEENVYTYNRDGYFYKDNDSCLDLFFASTKKEGWVNIYSDQEYRYPGENIFATKEEAIKYKDINYIATGKIEWEE